MPITTPLRLVDTYRGDIDHFSHVLEHLFAPAIEAADYEVVRPATQGADLIHAEIIRKLEESDLVLCDMSSLNANVFFELGIRTALDRPVCMVCDEETERVPFDTSIVNFHRYNASLEPWTLTKEVDDLTEHIRRTADGGERNSLWRYFGLTQRGTDAVKSAAADDPMDLVLSELQALRRDVTSPRPVPIPLREIAWQRVPSDVTWITPMSEGDRSSQLAPSLEPAAGRHGLKLLRVVTNGADVEIRVLGSYTRPAEDDLTNAARAAGYERVDIRWQDSSD